MASSLFQNGNPQISQQNNRIQQIKQMIGNRDPKTVFYEKCKELNVNPDDVLLLAKTLKM